MLISDDKIGAFVSYPAVELTSVKGGVLSDLTMAVKDVFDVAGYPTGCGHPLKQQASAPAVVSAPIVERLLTHGAGFIGKTITDELAFSLNGQNIHYGTPENVAAPGRIPGGSSAGSAAAVAAGMCDFAIGTDTGGSIRAPASYCGLIGLRPTHGRLSDEGCMPLAPSFDVPGWFARDMATFLKVSDVLFGDDTEDLPDKPVVRIVQDAVDRLMGDEEQDAFRQMLLRVETVLGSPSPLALDEKLEDWWQVFRVCQGYEAWQSHGAWIEAENPELGPGVVDRFMWSKTVTSEQYETACQQRSKITALMDSVVAGSLLVLPTVPSIAPRIEEDYEFLDQFRNRALSILCMAGLSGLPQISLPIGRIKDCPFGLSLIGPRNTDKALVSLASRIVSGIQA